MFDKMWYFHILTFHFVQWKTEWSRNLLIICVLIVRLDVTFSLTKKIIKYLLQSAILLLFVYATNVGTLAVVTMFVTQPLIGRHVSTARTLANDGAGHTAQYWGKMYISWRQFRSEVRTGGGWVLGNHRVSVVVFWGWDHKYCDYWARPGLRAARCESWN